MRLLFRVDSSVQMGTGHVMRCLALAQVCHNQEYEVLFAMASSTPSLEERLAQEGISMTRVAAALGSDMDIAETVCLAQTLDVDWVILDGYHFTSAYQQALKDAQLKLLFLDDYGHASYYVADLILNQNIYARTDMYQHRASYTQLLLGSQYVMLRQEFLRWRGWKRQINTMAHHLLVTLGGADPENATLKMITTVQRLHNQHLEVIILVGGSNPNLEQLQQAGRASLVPIKVIQNAMDMPNFLAWADVAIAAGGTTSWELAFMGLPSLMVILADNQQRVADHLGELGIAINLGWAHRLSEQTGAMAIAQLLNSYDIRRTMSLRGQQLIDGRGAERVLAAMSSMD